MATTTSDPWGQTPLTAEGLASLDHPLSLSDFNQDAGGYWRIIRGQKTYYPREWFDAGGTFTGTGTQAGDRAGQDQGFFKTGMRWNWDTGQWENPTNWANVIGLAAAGGVGGAFAAPLIAGAAAGGGGAAAGGGVGLGETGAVTGLGGSGFGAAGGGAALGGTILKGAIGPAIQAGTSIYNTKQQTDANAAATDKQVEANKYAADLQAKSAAESLAFQRAQAQYNAQVAESTRAANYDQWAAKQTQLGSVGQALGLPARAIPAYVPLPPDASLTLGAPGTSAPPSAPGATPPPAGTPAASPPPATPAGADAAWWNPQDPRGSVNALFAGAAPTSQAILDRKAQIEAAGGQISPANAEGVTSKIYLPGVGWTRILDGGVAGGPGGGQGTGWTFVPQGAGATAPRMATGNTDALGSVASYFGPAAPAFGDPAQATGRLTLPRYQPVYGGAVGSYL